MRGKEKASKGLDRAMSLGDHSGFWVQKQWGAGTNKRRKKVRKLLQ